MQKWANRDNLGAVILDRDIFWIEATAGGSITNYAHDYIIKFLEKQGYKYLYNK
jgi:hypothetical protein